MNCTPGQSPVSPLRMHAQVTAFFRERSQLEPARVRTVEDAIRNLTGGEGGWSSENQLTTFLWQRRGEPPAALVFETLSALIEDRCLVDENKLERERLLLESLEGASVPETLGILDSLLFFYTGHLRMGGAIGVLWTRSVREALLAEVKKQESYTQFITRDDSGRILLKLPSDLDKPAGLHFDEELRVKSGRPDIILLPASESASGEMLLYVYLPALLFPSHEVPADRIATLADLLESGERIKPIHVIRHFESEALFVEKGTARAKLLADRGFNYILARLPERRRTVFPKQTFRIGDLEVQSGPIVAAPTTIPPVPIPRTLGFIPHFHPEFPPLGVTLNRQGRDCPLVIERVTPDEAAALLQGDLLASFQEYYAFTQEDPQPSQPFILLARTLDGTVEGFNLNTLVSRKGFIRMRCDRIQKLDRQKQTTIEDLGLAMFMASLRYMKKTGYWYPGVDLLYDLNPDVLIAFRKRAGLTTTRRRSSKLVASITTEECERFLHQSPLQFEEWRGLDP